MASLDGGLGSFVSEDEAEDIANAIAASLDTAQVEAKHIEAATWEPMTDEQRKTLLRQKEALQNAMTDKWFPNLSNAINASLDEANRTSTAPTIKANTDYTDGVNGTKAYSSERRYVTANAAPPSINNQASTSSISNRNIDEKITDMRINLALRVPSLSEADGDTYVFMDPPSQQPEQDDASYQHYCDRFVLPMVMKSTTLFELQSPFFDKALGPVSQYRVQRRRGLVGKLPCRIKYVLDLTPSIDGEDAVHLVMEMCCPESVRKWKIAGMLWPISKTLIGGRDDFSPESDYEKPTSLAKAGSLSNQDKCTHLMLKQQEATRPIPLEYTPIQHRCAIDRLLLAVSKIDPGLDSAPKVWTISVIAAFYQAQNSSALLDFVVSWVHRNSYFVEVLPEVVLRIADNLKCYDLCRNTFAILIGEEAFDSVYRKRINNPNVTAYGRKREYLPEEYRTRVEYASKVFSSRVTDEFTRIVSANWLDELPEFLKLSQMALQPLKNPRFFESYQRGINSLKDILKRYVRGAISRLVCSNYPVQDSSALQQWHYAHTNSLFPIKGPNERIEFWNSLTPYERVLTYSFWESLSLRHPFRGPTNMVIDGGLGYAISLPQLSNAEQDFRNDKDFEEITLAQIRTSARHIENMRSCQIDKTFHDDYVGKDIPMFGNAGTEHVGDSKKLFNLDKFLNQADEYVKKISRSMTTYANSDLRNDLDRQPLVDILGCLKESEWRYLPLWAGGCDDGSGGVYEDSLPNASAGFSHPGPNVHIGPDSTAASSEFDFIQGPNMNHTSTVTNGGSRDCVPSDVESGVFIRQDLSVFGDSEYDFGSFASVDESKGEQEPSAISTANAEHPPSAKAQGKKRLRDEDNVGIVSMNLRRLELGEQQRNGALWAQKGVSESKGKNALYNLNEAEAFSTDLELSAVVGAIRGETFKAQENSSTDDKSVESLFPEDVDDDEEGGTVTGQETDEESEACTETAWDSDGELVDEFSHANLEELMDGDPITDGEECGDTHSEVNDTSDLESDFTLVGFSKSHRDGNIG